MRTTKKNMKGMMTYYPSEC